ncbi:hypothetical protein JHK85_011872 [Glycine max]|nr:hypothetical protein JHK85_011872 [Glycine max]
MMMTPAKEKNPVGMAKSASNSVMQTLKRFMKKPWEITGPCAGPEYKSALPLAVEYRLSCPATVKEKPIIPNSLPETVYDIKYFTRDQRRNRPPIRRTVLKNPDVEKLMKEQTFAFSDFPPFISTPSSRRTLTLAVADTSD